MKFAGLIGFMLGYQSAVIACLAASLFGISYFILLVRVTKGKIVMDKRQKIPFAPFMSAGVICSLIAQIVVT